MSEENKNSTNKVFCGSEIGALKRVIIHRPDEGIARITPKRATDLLFDDIVQKDTIIIVGFT